MPFLVRRFSVLLAALLLVPVVTAQAQNAAPVTRAGEGAGRSIDPNSLFELVNQIDRLEREVQALRGQLDQQRFEMNALRSRQTDLYADVDRRVRGLESGSQGLAANPAAAGAGVAPVTSASATTTGAPPLAVLQSQGPVPVEGTAEAGASGLSVQMDSAQTGSATAATPAAPARETVVMRADSPSTSAPPPAAGVPAALTQTAADPEAAADAYKAAFGLLKSGNYDDAIAAFNAYLVDYPRSEYADNAQYWLGEAFYVTRKFDAAIGEYNKLLQSYPGSAKAPHAVLKIGYSQQALGNTDAARTSLEHVLANYPNTTASKLASERLARLDAPAAAP